MRSKKANIQSDVEERHQQVKKLLKGGFSVAEVCKAVGLTPKRVYVVARRFDLPTNPHVWPQSMDESSIARLSLAGWTNELIGEMFGHSAASIQRIIERVQQDPVIKETAERIGFETSGNSPRRRTRKEAAPAAKHSRGTRRQASSD